MTLLRVVSQDTVGLAVAVIGEVVVVVHGFETKRGVQAWALPKRMTATIVVYILMIPMYRWMLG